VAGVLYACGVVRLARERTGLVRVIAFYAGLAFLALALLSPLDVWAARSFAAHMIQHELLMLAAAPLLVLGHPLPMFLWAFPDKPRRAIARFVQQAGVRNTWTFLRGAGCAWVLHLLALWVWHVPYFFNAALSNRVTHDLQHVTFLATALLFWSALFEARRSTQRGAAIVYLFTTTIHTGVLGALITLASRPWYLSSSLEDQQLGGLIMWVPGSIVYVGAALFLFARWIESPAVSRSG
jgi:cytochrome c oxidase assembly factor CtaG